MYKRQPSLWPERVLAEVCEAGALLTSVPKVSSTLAALASLDVVLYCSQSSRAELLNMAAEERKLSFFAHSARIVGEASQADSSQEFVQISFKDGNGYSDMVVPLERCFNSARQIECFFDTFLNEAGLLVFCYTVSKDTACFTVSWQKCCESNH